MKITAVESIVADIPFREPFVVWRGSITSKRHVFAAIETDRGLTGYGEAPPFLFYAPETAADVHSMIAEHLAAELIGRDPRDVRAILDRFAIIDGHHFAKAAVETALWDLLGQSAGLPIYRLLGGAVRPSVPVVAVLHTGDPVDTAREARDCVQQGFNRLKLKIGFGLDGDEAVIASVREAVGHGPLLRVDAEERYTVKDTVALAERIGRYDIELISQPVPRTDWDGMAFLRGRLPMPLLVDEGIAAPADVLHCVRLGAADMINIKVLKCEGLLRSLELAAVATTAHLAVVIGSMIEAGIGTLIGAHVALLLPGTVSTELCGPILFADDFLTQPLRIKAGELRLGDTPGLGGKLDRQRLERYRVAP